MAILDLIEHPDEATNEIVHREPQNSSGEFRLGSQLVVRESQRAIFVRDGKALDLIGPGRHTLSTQNIPLLTGLLGLPFGGKSPFRAEVFFVSMREITDLKWGTPQPLVFKDAEFGMVRLRAIGSYSMRVADPQLFVTQVVGTRSSFTTADLDDFLRGVIINEVSDLLGTVHTSLLDLQGMTRELADTARAALSDDFTRLGLTLSTFQVVAITPPDEVAKRIDERSGMGALGDMRTYTQFQTAQAIRDAANNPGTGGDMTGAGVGLGAGVGIGQAMAGSLRDAFAPQPPPVNPATGAAAISCPNCQTSIPATSKFCPNCGHNLAPVPVTCPKCGTENSSTSKFCTNCGAAVAAPASAPVTPPGGVASS